VSVPAAVLVPGASTEIDDFPVDLSWSPTGKVFAVAGGEGRLYRVAPEGGVPDLVGTHEPGLLSVAWQPRGERLATAGQDGSVRLWNAGDGAMHVAHRGRGWPAGLAWRNDGARLAFATGRSLHILDADGKPQLALDAHTANLSHLAWRGRDEAERAARSHSPQQRYPVQPRRRGGEQQVKAPDVLAQLFDVITGHDLVGTHAAEVEYWPTIDPTSIEGSREQRLDAYREVRDELLAHIRERFGQAAGGNE